MTSEVNAGSEVRLARPPAAVQRIVNAVIGRVLGSRRHAMVSGGLTLLHVRGRRSGRVYDIPVAYHRDGPAGRDLLVLTGGGWRRNLRGVSSCELTHVGTRCRADVELIESPEPVAQAYHAVIEGLDRRTAARRTGLRFPAGRKPTRAELLAAVSTQRLAVLRLSLRAT